MPVLTSLDFMKDLGSCCRPCGPLEGSAEAAATAAEDSGV